MTFIDKLSKLLLAPPATGLRALFYAVALIAIPTVIRLLLGLIIDRLPFFTYIPFVIVAAMVLDWKYAAAEALGSWIVADLMFIGPSYQLGFGSYEVIGFIVFLASAALLIALAEAVRVIVDQSLRPARPDGFSTPVVFSSEGGQAWASWYGSHSWVRLGPEDDVAEMMSDFLAQRALAKRLESSAKTAANP
jgi:hypothetical protein